MNKVLLAGLLLWMGCVSRVEAQRDPQFTQYMLNKLNYNPAYAGMAGNQVCATLLYHNQWTNFKSTEDDSKAPITQTFNIHAPIPIGNQEIGVGLHIVNDGLGYEKRIGAMGSIAYHKTYKFAKVSGGLNFGYNQVTLDGKWKTRDDNDPSISSKKISSGLFDVGAGIYLSDPKWYAGLSANHLTQPALGWTTTKGSFVPRVYYLMGGYNYHVNNTKVDIRPGALIKYDGAKTQVDIHTIVQYDNKYFAGLNYHTGDAISLILGMQYGHITGSYSYDLTVSDARPFGGKHEFLIKYCFDLNLLPKELNHHVDPRFL